MQSFARNVLINAVCKIHRFLQFPTADRDPAGNFEKLTICRTARKGKKNYRPYCKVQLKMPYILPDYRNKMICEIDHMITRERDTIACVNIMYVRVNSLAEVWIVSDFQVRKHIGIFPGTDDLH